MEPLTFAILAELGRQNRLDVLWFPRHQEADSAQESNLDTVGAFGSGPVEDVVVEVVKLVLGLVIPSLDKEGKA